MAEESERFCDEPLATDTGMSREREFRLEFLLALGTTGHLELALSLAEEVSLGADLRAVLLRHLLLRGCDGEAEAHLAFLRHDTIVAELVREALWHRLAAVVQVLCNNASAQQAMVLTAVSPEMLDRLVDLQVDEATARFVCADVVGALQSCPVLAGHPWLQQYSDYFQEPAAAAAAVLRAVCGELPGKGARSFGF
mmetsp:Transcript_82291/g.228360  ORF Transcript_82291/g.228360 Transcript_82291/m.228360 type:complete len:196 (+) Transcript_82291:3-590(+)